MRPRWWCSACLILISLLLVVVPIVLATEGHGRGRVLTRRDFPEGFTFGVAASAYQVEGEALKGGRGPCIWDDFVKVPNTIPDNATADVSTDEYHRYQDDIDIMKHLGFDAYRFSFSWSRIFPKGRGDINWEGVAYYDRLINYMIKQGITPYGNLLHYDLPSALEWEYMGWLSPRVVEDFANFADFCFERYGDRVKNWFTMNEPRVMAALGYDSGLHAPGRCTWCLEGGDSATEPYIAAHHLLLSHAAAVKRYREKYQVRQKGKIGILLDFVWFEPLTMSPADQEAAFRAIDFTLGWFLNPIIYGEYPLVMQKIVNTRLPKFTYDEVIMLKGSANYIGINQYTTYYATTYENNTVTSYSNDQRVGTKFERNGLSVGLRAHSHWLYIVPWGIYKAVTYVKEKYGNPTIILAENGMDQPGNITIEEGVNDDIRINYYWSYIANLKRAMDEGARVIGYFAWSLLDNFEWRLGYTSRFGIVYVDWKDLKRYPKKSAYWFQSMIKKHT